MNRRDRSIFRIILSGMLLLLGVILIMLVGCLHHVRLSEQLNQNASDILQQHTNNRKVYLENTLIKNFNLTELSDKIDEVVQEMMDSGELNIQDLGSEEEAYTAVLQNVSQDVIDTLRNKDVSGIFVVLNTKDMDKMNEDSKLPGLYIRDLDPDALPSYRNADLIIECSPIALVQSLFISTGRNWSTFFECGSASSKSFIYPVFQAAYEDMAQLDESDYGHLTTSTYTLQSDDRAVLAYSVPLILPDGTVYGVLGVEMLESYLQSMLPAEELENKETGTYYLAYTEAAEVKGEVPFRIALASSAEGSEKSGTILLDVDKDYKFRSDGEEYNAALQKLAIYNRNTPFSNEKWYLIASVPTKELFSLSKEIMLYLWIMILLGGVLGGMLCIIFSKKLSHPFTQMYKEVLDAKKQSDKIPKFTQTGVKELEQFAEAITILSKDIVDTSTKFLQIMKMASVELGGYEVRYDTDKIYITENFFALLGIAEKKKQELTRDNFHEILNELDEKYSWSKSVSGGKLYRIVDEKGNVRYIHMKKAYLNNSQVGIVEDETDATVEQLRIKYERDYDLLTNIYNRRALHKKYQKLFDAPQQLKYAAAMMIDLDNLKYVNDNFGHEYGDLYIQRAAQCLTKNLPTNSLYGRISGDEFFVFLYGYDTKEELLNNLDLFVHSVREKYIMLPNGTPKTISMSGGIAWYREHTTNPEMLKKYADFALYQIKKTNKGNFGVFVQSEYQSAMHNQSLHDEFIEMITKERIQYNLQPIISAKTGKIEAYEALMRSDMLTLRTPKEILEIARETSHLHDIERLTMFKSAEVYSKFKREGKIKEEMLFVNSISSQCLTEEEVELFASNYAELQNQIVIEVTEEEILDIDILEVKRKLKGFPKQFALDDYGNGYSNERTLLELQPQFIKIDSSLIRNIDKDMNKQQLVSYIISYSRTYNIRTIAEGIEKQGELEMVLNLGVDMLQGFYIASPKKEPQEISSEIVEIIRRNQRNKK